MSSTPILDLDQPPPEPSKSWLPKVLGLALGTFLVAIVILTNNDLLPQWHWPAFPAFNGLLLVPAFYAAIAFHEVGHLVAGNLVGLDTGGISVGGFAFGKSGKNWVFRFDRSRWLGGYFRPFTAVELHPSRYASCIAGGPLASIFLTAFCFFLYIQGGSGDWRWIDTLFWTSLFILLTSVIPYSGGLNKSDGSRLWQLLRYPERARSWIALLSLHTEEAKGLRPHEWNAKLFELILTVDSVAAEYLHCQMLAYYRRLDEDREDEAVEHLENALASAADSGVAMQQWLFLEAAASSAFVRHRSAQARCWSERACKLRKVDSLAVVDAGIAMCEGRYEEALQHWEAARARVLRQRLDSGLIRFAKEKWAKYEAACRTARG